MFRSETNQSSWDFGVVSINALQYGQIVFVYICLSNLRSTNTKISRIIAQCVTDLAAAAELLKDDDWVDPSDPTFIAENELLGAAKSIDAAAKKLAALKPRGEIKGKVRRLLLFLSR